MSESVSQAVRQSGSQAVNQWAEVNESKVIDTCL